MEPTTNEKFTVKVTTLSGSIYYRFIGDRKYCQEAAHLYRTQWHMWDNGSRSTLIDIKVVPASEGGR
jgi:hypothetical protein